MREYAKVTPNFWIGSTGKKLRAAGMEAQIVSLYLITCPHANMLGLFYCPLMFIAHETGLGLEGASKGLQRATEAGFCEYDDDSEVVWVVEMAAYQVAESLKASDNRAKGIQSDYDALPENPFLSRFFDKYEAAFCMTNRRGNVSPSEGGFKGAPKPRAGAGARAGERKGPAGSAPAKPLTQSATRFAEFWQAWPAGPRKQAKAECEKKWKARGLDDLADEIIGHVRAILKTKQFQDFTPAPLTYLNQRRWEDGAPSGGDDPADLSPFRGAL